jgi:CDGSH-type Zn-finger protein
MADSVERKITVTRNGPYLVRGGASLQMQTIGTDAEGASREWIAGRAFETRPTYLLCRCGHSSTKPFCDGTHAKIGFEGTETATRAPYDEQAKIYDGPDLELEDAEALCAFARFCDNDGTIWRGIAASDDPTVRQQVVDAESRCPSGRLVLREKRSGEKLEPALEASIGVVEDPSKQCSGPLWVRGGIRVESADGEAYEVRNRVTLCRCGESSNKPFCDGAHAEIGFRDGIAAENAKG